MLFSLAIIILISFILAGIFKSLHIPGILAIAVLAIVITAPIGAIGIDGTYDKLLLKQ